MILLGCQPESGKVNETDTPSPASVAASSNNSEATPLLTLDELLNASDFQAGIKQSVLNNDKASLKDWQDQLIEVAKEVHLAQRDVNRISGEQGLVFIEFEAKKRLFNDEFIELFMNFESVDGLIQKYPYLTGVHDRALSLIAARDAAIERAASMLSEEGVEGDATLKARAQWQDYMINSGRLESLKN